MCRKQYRPAVRPGRGMLRPVRSLTFALVLLCPVPAVAAEEAGGPVPEHIRPCLETLPALPATQGKSTVVVMDRGNECDILVLFELQSDLENYRRARVRAGLSPDYIVYKQADGSMWQIKLELRRSAVW